MKKIFGVLLALGVIALMGWAFYEAMYLSPLDAAQGEAWRIFYYHVPHGMLCYLFFSINFVASALVLVWRRSQPEKAIKADAWALSGAEVGVLYCSVVLATGPIWARPIWGIWWTWDARLTSTLVLWLIYVSYLLVRRFSTGAEAQVLAAVLAVFGAIDMPINYMANRIFRTQHPSPVFGGDPDSGIKDPRMSHAFVWNILAWAVWGLVILGIRVAVERRQQRIDAEQARQALAAD